MYGVRQKSAAMFLALTASSASPTLSAQITPTLRVGLVDGGNSVATAASIGRGVRLGAAEAKQTANLFGGDVLLFEAVGGSEPERAAQRLLSERKVQVLLGSSAKDADALSRFANSHHVIFINAASRSPTLRAACHRYTFHVEASDSMYAIASRRLGRLPGGSGSSVVLWAPTFEKYGASQINDRYRARYQLLMDGGAWAGWVAIKIVAEAALRTRSDRADAILSYLESPAATFDGHKGWPLSFRSADHQLRQPLYMVLPNAVARAGAAVREIPELSTMSAGAMTAGTTQALDALMPAAASGCARGRG